MVSIRNQIMACILCAGKTHFQFHHTQMQFLFDLSRPQIMHTQSVEIEIQHILPSSAFVRSYPTIMNSLWCWRQTIFHARRTFMDALESAFLLVIISHLFFCVSVHHRRRQRALHTANLSDTAASLFLYKSKLHLKKSLSLSLVSLVLPSGKESKSEVSHWAFNFPSKYIIQPDRKLRNFKIVLFPSLSLHEESSRQRHLGDGESFFASIKKKENEEKFRFDKLSSSIFIAHESPSDSNFSSSQNTHCHAASIFLPFCHVDSPTLALGGFRTM